jgi:hypothetical protein
LNHSIDTSLMSSVMPTGDYRLIMRYWDEEAVHRFLNITAVFAVKSSDKESFG